MPPKTQTPDYFSPKTYDEMMAACRRIKHVALDMDGTIYMGSTLFPFTKDFLARLTRLGIGYSFLTNNPTRSIADYLKKLAKLGIEATDEDVEKGARFADVVIHRAWFLIDIHHPAGGGQAEGHSQPATPYDIPLRSLIPAGLDGLLLSGRCISGTYEAHASYRVTGDCVAMGQAAGTAAALALEQGLTPRALDGKRVAAAMEQQGARLK